MWLRKLHRIYEFVVQIFLWLTNRLLNVSMLRRRSDFVQHTAAKKRRIKEILNVAAVKTKRAEELEKKWAISCHRVVAASSSEKEKVASVNVPAILNGLIPITNIRSLFFIAAHISFVFFSGYSRRKWIFCEPMKRRKVWGKNCEKDWKGSKRSREKQNVLKP